MIPEYLTNLIPQSVVKQHERGLRRYFPIKSTEIEGWEYLKEAFFIIYGRNAIDNSEIGFAILNHSLDRYVEKFDGKLWVRTICV